MPRRGGSLALNTLYKLARGPRQVRHDRTEVTTAMTTFNFPTRILLTEPISREDRLKEALSRLLVFSNRFRRAHPSETKLRARINALDGRIAAYSDETYPAPHRDLTKNPITRREREAAAKRTPRDDGWVMC